MLIDSHCHLDRLKLDCYGGDLEKALNAARQVGVERMLCVGIDLEHADAVIHLAETYQDVYASVGIHPLEKDAAEPDLQTLLDYARHTKVIAIGESGLDYYYSADNKAVQQERFKIHLQAAAQSQLPIIVHTRDARKDTLDLIRQHGNLDRAGVLHCFTESWEMAREAMELNYFISISGIVTFRNAAELREVVKKVPLDRLLIETDSPYLAPVPHRGKSNEPRYLPDVAKCVAELKGISGEELAEVTSENFFRLFPKAASC
ncbi:TatD family hydrolase [Endozoicomonas numazuensis]|uniref:Hydrolase TatD n=1 Tax=Endozoicomonas numazuensis TaxID=1137799 RepID=A0A081N402_9GAMM|nr:TatD family hydrolase [Endozoicomonas numazuensis]KEQ13175.1 hydrolase TatD [Endozoicomonas numazuensis]